MSEEKALDKIDIKSELKVLSPIEARSIELKEQAEAITIEDKPSYQEAKKVKRELVSHRTTTKNLRLTFTRKLDNLKDQFIKKQDEVLEPSIAGEDVIKEKIAAWEKAEAERKEAEEKRIADMVAKIVTIPDGFDVQTGSLEDVKRLRAALKMERGLLDANDRNRVAVKNATEEVTRKLDSAEEFITARIEQERIAEEQRKEQERLDADRKKLEAEQAAAAKEKEEAAKASAPAPTPAPVAEPAKGSGASVKESIPDVQGGMEALATNPARDMAKAIADTVDQEMFAFLKKQGYEVDPRNIQATIDLMRAKGYRVIDEVQNIYEGGVSKTKHTYLYVQVIDQVEFITEARITLED